MTDAALYVGLTFVPLVAMGWLGPRLGRSTAAPLVPSRMWHTSLLWVLGGAVALLAELGGQAAGLWDWSDPVLLAVHAWWWWATLLLVGLLRLRPLGPVRWFVVQLTGTLAFEFGQQALLGWVTHPPLFGSRYLQLVAIHVVVAGVVVTMAPNLALRAGLLRRSWGT